MKFLANLFGGIASAWQACLFALALGVFGGGFGVYKVMHNANLAGETKTVIAEHRLVNDELKINVELGQLYVPKFVFVATETQRVKSEIPQHVTPEIDRTHPVPLGFVRVWNDLPGGPIPPATAGSDADPSGIALSSVADAGVATQGAYETCRVSLTAWWDWYDRNAVVWNKAHGK
jgi:hypothetical protein